MGNNGPLNISYGNTHNAINNMVIANAPPQSQPRLTRAQISSNTVTRRNYSPTRGRANVTYTRSTSPTPQLFEAQKQTFMPLNSTTKGRASLTHIKGINRSSGSRSLIRTRKARRQHRSNRA